MAFHISIFSHTANAALIELPFFRKVIDIITNVISIYKSKWFDLSVGSKFFCLLLILFSSYTSICQTTLVEWNFPYTPDNAQADGGTANNLAQTINTNATGVIYTLDGATTKSASATGWNNGNGTKYWQVAVNTQGYASITLFSKQRSSPKGPRNFKVEYSVDGGIVWADVPASNVTVADDWASGVLTNIGLPATCSNQVDLRLRWIMTSDISVDGSTVINPGTSRIDDIIVQGILCNVIVSSFVPNSGPVGTIVTITGSGFTGATNVFFSGVPVLPGNHTVVNDNTIIAIVPTIIASGPITVVGANCSSFSSTSFQLINICSGNGSNLIISELCDPQYNYQTSRYIEIYNPTSNNISLSGWKVVAIANGSQCFTWTLSGSIAPGQALTCGNNNPANGGPHTFGMAGWVAGSSGCCFDWNGQRRDGAILYQVSTIIDYVKYDDTDANWYADASLVRNANVCSPSTTTIPSQWSANACNNAGSGGSTPRSHVSTCTGTAPSITLQPVSKSVCVNSTVTFQVNATGGVAPYIFQWKYFDVGIGTWQNIVNGANYSGANTSVLTINGALSLNNYQYYCEVSNSDNTCFVASNAVQLKVNTLPTATISGTTSVCQNAASPYITFTGASGTSPYTFTYTINGGANTNITTTSGNSVTLAVSTATPGIYIYNLVSVSDANSCSQSQSGSATVTINPLPQPPTTITVDRDEFCFTDNGNISLTANGGLGTTLQWFSGSCGPAIIGVGNPLTIPSPITTTTYFARWTNGCGTSACTSKEVTVNNVTAGAIAANQTICYAGDPSLIISTTNGAGMGSISYRWESSIAPFTIWNPVVGAFGATYDPPAGSTVTTQYRRITVSNHNGTCESVPTAEITITVQDAINPGSIAADQSICFNGSTVPFTSVVNGTGSGVITYRWERAVSPFTIWTTIGGATLATYNPGALTMTTAFRRIAISTQNGVSCESIASNVVTVYVQDLNVTAGSIGNNQTICNGEIPLPLVSLVDGTGSSSAVISYEWQMSIDNGVTWTTIGGETASGLTLPALTQNTQYKRRTIATLAGNMCSSGYTVAVLITVQRIVTAGSIAANQTICNGVIPAALTSVQNGTSPNSAITYMWEQSTDGGTTWSVIGGANQAGYSPAAPTQTTHFRRTTIATLNGHPCFSPPTNTVVITVHLVAQPGSIAASQTICYGAIPAPLTSVVSGSGSSAPSYTWEFSINSGGSWILIAGANTQGYSPGALSQNTWYRRIATYTLNGVSCSAATAHIEITVQGQIVAPVVSANQTICYNTVPAVLNRTNATGGSGSFSYQWQYSADNISWSDLPGQTGLSYAPPALTVTMYYRVVSTSSCGVVISNIVTILVRQKLVEPIICCSQTGCLFADILPLTITTPVTGGSGNFSYQWEISTDGTTWTPIAGATGQTYNPTQAFRYYRLRVTDIVCLNSVYSSPVYIEIAIDAGFTFDIQPNAPNPLCPGAQFSPHISAVHGSWAVIRYEWTVNNSYLTPTTGGPTGTTSAPFWIFFRTSEANLGPLTANNPTNASVTSVITITPKLYNYPGPPTGSFKCNTTPQILTVTIQPFKIVCPANIGPVNTSAGSCTATINIPAVSYIGPCSASSLTWVMTGATTLSGTGNIGSRLFNAGVTTITYTAKNQYNVESTCAFTVTVTDNQAPTITCPANITLPAVSGCSRIVNYTPPVGTDNCSGTTTIQISGLPSGSAFPVGTTTNTFRVTDASGNQASCSFTITITDNQPPTITCPPNYNVNTDPGLCTATFDPADPTVTDNCYNLLAITWNMTGASTGSSPATGFNFVGNTTFNPGTTTITYTARDPGGNQISCTFIVTVVDNEVPVITGPGGYSVANDPGECSALVATSNPEISDNCTLDCLTWSMSGATIGNSSGSGINYIGTYTFHVGVTIVTYTLTDISGNTVQWQFAVIVTDTECPLLQCPADPQSRNSNTALCSYVTQGTEFDPIHSDNCPGFNLSNNLTGGPTLAGFVFQVGTTNVRWTIADAANNTDACDFNVIVIDNQSPLIVNCAPPQNADANSNCQAAVPNVTSLLVVTDNCTLTGNFSFLQTPPAGTFVGIGSTTITITVFDQSGQTAMCQTTFNVIDNTPPVLTCAPALAASCNSSSAILPYTNLTAFLNAGGATSDNCGINQSSFVLLSEVSDGLSCPETIIRTYLIADLGGLTATCTQSIVVDDIVPPVITCKINGTQTVNINSGSVYLHSGNSWDYANVTDNCVISNTSVILTGATNSGPHPGLNGISFNQGLTHVVWTTVDGCGNSASCTFDVIVEGMADISVSKAGPATITTGQLIIYTITITNNGPATAPQVTLTDVIPPTILNPTFTLDGIPQGVWISPQLFTSLSSGSSHLLVVSGKADCSVTGTIVNSATVALGTLIDPLPANNTASVTTTVVNILSIIGIVTNTTCPGENNGSIDIEVAGGTAPYTYAWSNGAITQDINNLIAGTYTVIVTDANGCAVSQQFIVAAQPDTQPPTFTIPGPSNFCVNNLVNAIFNPNPTPGIIPEYDDITAPRPEYFLFTSGNTIFDLDPAINNFNDNCCADNQLIIHWRIVFAPTPNPATALHEMITQPAIPDQTGNPSSYGNIVFAGDGVFFANTTHSLYYWLVDCNGNPSSEQVITITIKPRPDVIKQ